MAKVKGTTIKSTLDWVRKNNSEQATEKILLNVPEDSRKIVQRALPSSWYPVEVMDALWDATIKQMAKDNRQQAEEIMRNIGQFIAEENLSTIYKIVLKFKRPQDVLGLFPTTWKLYFRDIDVTIVEDDVTGRKGLHKVRGLGKLRYIGPGASGWQELAYRKVGAKSATILEKNWKAGRDSADELLYDSTWS